MTIVVTQPAPENYHIRKKLTDLGVHVIQFPTIDTVGVEDVTLPAEDYDWLVFTSIKGVAYFLKHVEVDTVSPLRWEKIAVVGPKTKQGVKFFGLDVNFMPTIYNTTTLAQELPDVAGRNILLARSNIAPKQIIHDLAARGAHVTDLAVYQTILLDTPDHDFENLIKTGKIDCITFTSPSTIQGFFTRIQDDDVKKSARAIPVLSVGPLTTKTAKQFGFTTITTADTHTVEGMLEKLQEGKYREKFVQ